MYSKNPYIRYGEVHIIYYICGMVKYDLIRLGVLRDISDKAYLCVLGINNRVIVPKSVVVCRHGDSHNYWVKGFFSHKIDSPVLCSQFLDSSFMVKEEVVKFLNGLDLSFLNEG